MSITRRLPKRGFTNANFKTIYSLITLDQLESLFQAGTTITKAMLVEVGCVKKRQMVKLLATGALNKKLKIEINACSKSAKEAVERVGGEVKLVQE